MSQFEFFMTFYSLLLGLGVAELMLGFANILRAKVRPRRGRFERGPRPAELGALELGEDLAGPHGLPRLGAQPDDVG